MAAQCAAAQQLRYFPVGPIYEYRWKLLKLALDHTQAAEQTVLQPFPDEVSQDRGVALLQSGKIDVIALGTNQEREDKMLPIKIDISRGIVGFRVLIIRAADQARIKSMDDRSLRNLTFGLNDQWADVPVMRANGLKIETSMGYENLFSMLAAKRFDAFPRGLNEAKRELEQRKATYPQLALELTKALYFPFPIYFWVNKNNTGLARRIERGLKLALADGSFRRLFESYYAAEIASLKSNPRHVIHLKNPILPAGNQPPDTSWWWRQ
ncbi:ABC transporter substrate-binding protein [Pseudogulbenkiania sp. MAI-1]|uniref:substrate-binding periplasmic protein n=1 Tax=Pseudogulbenkiania sp. MAI-1 TaxID=990370 RepID=UPI00045E667A|nr:transporter substrate-binding domain-containing protein [Pseudogulbenkiania sp. MAI-1]